jgi:hypothetical protein
MKKVLIFALSLFSIRAVAQDSLFLYEQYATDYFIDSLLATEFPKIKNVNFINRIDSQHTVLDYPVKFKNYISTHTPDTTMYYIVRKDQRKIEELDLDNRTLIVKQMKGYDFKLFDSKEQVDRKSGLLIKLRKRYTYKPDLFVVQLIVYAKEFKYYYFFEFNRNSKNVNQWYKTEWMF